ncbi:cytochrome P450 [Rhodococcus sp. 27YEA15]|uniref:cytochrome P450 n=1 Tax=Rhodococcus sp. 27YEA15 TaxID=3156259 RepID=UPI003C7D1B4E
MTNQATELPAGHPPIGFDRDSGVDLSSYRDVEEMLRSRSFGMEGSYEDSLEFVEGSLIAIDGRAHLNRRKAMARMLSPKMPWGAEGTAFDEIFGYYLRLEKEKALPGATEIRFNLFDFSSRVYWRLMAQMIGIDQIETEEEIERFRAVSGHLVGGIVLDYVPPAQRDQARDRAREAMAQIREEAYLPSFRRRLELVREAGDDAAKKTALPGDLITSMIAVQDDLDDIDDSVIFREMTELLAAAVNNPVIFSVYGLDDVLPWLETHPEDREKIRDRAFLNKCMSETLRLHRVTRPYLVRKAKEDASLGNGQQFRAGQWVKAWVGRADRDELVFGDAVDEYNPRRQPLVDKVTGFGMAFGGGPHMCLGRPILIWEQGENDAQGLLAKMLRLQLEHGIRPDPDVVQQVETTMEGGVRYVRYDVVMPL